MNIEQIKALVHEAVKKETEAMREEIKNLNTEMQNLKEENKKLKDKVMQVDRGLDSLDQYGRKSSLILGGAFPEGEEWENPQTTRDTATKVIKEKLRVDLKGSIAACHRLRNGKRVIVKFNDMQDREAVYQAKFAQDGEGRDRISVQENLTSKRSKMMAYLEELRKEKVVVNYHSKNGIIMARSSTNTRYVRIEPWYTRDEIIEATAQAPEKKQTREYHNTNLMQSQTLRNLPQGHTASLTADLEQFVVAGKARPTQKAKKGGDALEA